MCVRKERNSFSFVPCFSFFTVVFFNFFLPLNISIHSVFNSSIDFTFSGINPRWFPTFIFLAFTCLGFFAGIGIVMALPFIARILGKEQLEDRCS